MCYLRKYNIYYCPYCHVIVVCPIRAEDLEINWIRRRILSWSLHMAVSQALNEPHLYQFQYRLTLPNRHSQASRVRGLLARDLLYPQYYHISCNHPCRTEVASLKSAKKSTPLPNAETPIIHSLPRRAQGTRSIWTLTARP